MRFGVLGPPEVSKRTGPIRLTPKLRALLAALLTRPNATVPAGELIDAVWSGAPPPSASDSLRIYVHQLRRALGDADRIVRTPTGFRLVVGTGELDAAGFEELVEAAKASGDLADRARLLADALRDWRGPAFAGLADLPVVREEAARLDDLRQTAAADRIDAELTRGRHAAVVAEVAGLVEQHPYAERLRGQLMLALYRLGRSAEALEVFRADWQLLAVDLGQQPGAALRELEHAILTNDPALDPEPARTVPRELPPDLATFTGRVAESRWITRALERHPVVAISGPGGAGKSTLAIHTAHQIAGRFPDGQLYVDLHGSTPDVRPLEPAEVLARFLRSLGLPAGSVPAGEVEAGALFRSLTHNLRLLVVLDNAYDTAQVRPLLPGGATCAVLVTGRRALTSLDAATHQLDALDHTEAAALLSRIAGAGRLAADPAAADEVVRLCGRLPLAIGIAAARLVTRPRWTVRTLVDRLAVEDRRLSELAADDRSVRTSFAVSYADLATPAAARMFRLLGLLDGVDVSVPVAAAIADVPVDRAETLLDELVDVQLATTSHTRRYRLHDLLRLFARERAAAEESAHERTEARLRAMHCYVGSATSGLRTIMPAYEWRLRVAPVDKPRHAGVRLSTAAEVTAWLAAERENLLVTAGRAVRDDPELVMNLAAPLSLLLEYRGRWRDHLSLAELTRRAAEQTGDPLHGALAGNDLGWSLMTLGRIEESLGPLENAVRAWRRGGNGDGEALSLHGLGAAHRLLGRQEKALAILREAVAVARRCGNIARAASCLTTIGLTYQSVGAYEQAVRTHTEAVALSGKCGIWINEVMTLGGLAEVRRLTGDPARAAEIFQQALETGRASGYRGTYWEAEHLWGLGRARHDQGLDGAECWRAAARILCDLGLIQASERAAIDRGDHPDTPMVIAERLA
ncbi:AfsR/SARP family transcriptional regulator [Fodinicola acaciae]|uniref:AfsR/SARP family transcriptional regulator n=1 Tax=Fodinicola acaciae TaxID=2681555 RepID=UPI0013D72772|nr:BTAD domain-containing putative transcriptional regulator [Fodinicola acaciae]